MRSAMAFLTSMLFLPLCFSGEEPPVIPVGLDAYRGWDRWHVQRIGARAYMRSTYDRRGGNEAADASHFLFQLAENLNVALDVEGPGVLYFVRTNHWHGSPWHYVIDGIDHVVRETSTADPLRPVEGSVFEPRELFPPPLAWTWSETKGADLSWVPIPFERSFRLAYSRTHYGTGYYIYHQYVRGIPLSCPLRAWDGKTPPEWDVLDLISRAGTDLAPPAGQGGVREESGEVDLPEGDSVALGRFEAGPAAIRALELSVPEDAAAAFSKAFLSIVWDGRRRPSIDAPVPLFFGAGTLYNRDGKEYLVRAFPASIRFAGGRVRLACYFPMPFFRSASISLRPGGGGPVRGIRWRAVLAPLAEPPGHTAYFHATYRDHPSPERGKDLVLLDTREEEGGGDWSGHFAGMSWIFSDRAVLNTLEGDPRFFFDDSRSPQAQGTGTEEWGGGGDYWGGRTMTLPFAGHPVGAPSPKEAKCEEDRIESAYRFLLADLMPFGKNARIQLEHGGTNESTERYRSVVYWYGLPAPSLVLTDELDVGDAGSEAFHGYSSPEASPPAEVVSRFEWGIDALEGKEVFPAEKETGRTTRGTSEFSLKVEPRNLGVLLRRTLDYSYPNQRAEVYVAADAPAGDGGGAPRWEPAGIWYLAGSNTCVYSNPKDELGPAQHVVQTSNRRLREDEFLIPRPLTEGRSRIRVRVKFTPVAVPLYPDHPLPELAWSELWYKAYCFVIPAFTPEAR